MSDALTAAMKRYGLRRIVVTERLWFYGAAMSDIDNQDHRTLSNTRTTEPRIHIDRSDDESAPLIGSGEPQPYKSSPPLTPRSIITSTLKDISKAGLVSKPCVMRRLWSGSS